MFCDRASRNDLDCQVVLDKLTLTQRAGIVESASEVRYDRVTSIQVKMFVIVDIYSHDECWIVGALTGHFPMVVPHERATCERHRCENPEPVQWTLQDSNKRRNQGNIRNTVSLNGLLHFPG